MPERAFPSPAKLNLFLHITGRRPDGYHNLQTLFQFIDFCDMLYITPQPGGQIRLEEDIPGVPREANLIYRAADTLRQTTGCRDGASIRIEKQLPMGGGLGGGSSNAATTLVALNHLWNTGLSEDDLAEIGLTLGADVPVFVRGKAALAEGVGEELTPVNPEEPWYLILIPDCHVETAALFADKCLTRNTNPIRIRAFLEGLEPGHNDFEPVARRLFPEIETGFQLLSQLGKARLTGTGACLFCDFPTRDAALKASQKLQALAPKGYRFKARVAKGVNISPLQRSLL
ncbi:MAG: 4-(cytidine 5'-diphospho)-2-C-methyl-D-erythritol kinase [Ketobacteraceae bacterium]|nr:4-(cytidine 5'-diphospho)-2-C-methyl-D-erythritol kinase [Ketobacteraceae bacterium]